MKISEPARLQLEALAATSERGSMVSMLIGYTHQENGSKLPQVDITVLPRDMVLEMERQYAEFGDQLVQQIDGFKFALPIPNDDGLLDGWRLTHTENEGFGLVRATS